MPIPVLGYEIGAAYQQIVSVDRPQSREEIRDFLCARCAFGNQSGDHMPTLGDLNFFAFEEQALDLLEGVTKVAD